MRWLRSRMASYPIGRGRLLFFTPFSLTKVHLHTSRETTTSSEAATPEAALPIDAKAAEQIRIATEIGEKGFEENVKILKQLSLRGLRAFSILTVGLGALFYSKKRWSRLTAQREAEES
ncbi:unnamed protein product [Phytomonas sp. Hart1]|nr:unnamed protein product [Phytomonas sp. Hart1]|eukprot:CCW69455.1 unnamed protein product [Phytomonas sp. isolate Hart1]